MIRLRIIEGLCRGGGDRILGDAVAAAGESGTGGACLPMSAGLS